MASFSDRIQEAMRVRHMRQVDLVEATGIHRGTISNYIHGKYEPKNDSLYAIAKALNVNPAWLVGFSVPMDIQDDVEYTSPSDQGYLKIEWTGGVDPNPTQEEWAAYLQEFLTLPEDTRITMLKTMHIGSAISQLKVK